MADRTHDHDRTGEDPEALSRDVHEALKSAGWVVPETEVDVRRAEEELPDAPGALPGSLGDPAAVLRRPAGAEPRTIGFPLDDTAAENLARAAREGGKIPPEIEEIMRRDRRAAEEELDRNEHGEDVG